MPFPESGQCPAGTICSGSHSLPTSTRYVVGEDWPPPQVAWGHHQLVSLVQYCHCSFHRLNPGKNTFSLAPSHLLKCVVSLLSKPTLKYTPESPRKIHRDLEHVSNFQKSPAPHRCSRIFWKVDLAAGSRPSVAMWAPRFCLWVPVSCESQLTPWSLAVFHL